VLGTASNAVSVAAREENSPHLAVATAELGRDPADRPALLVEAVPRLLSADRHRNRTRSRRDLFQNERRRRPAKRWIDVTVQPDRDRPGTGTGTVESAKACDKELNTGGALTRTLDYRKGSMFPSWLLNWITYEEGAGVLKTF
jgi:hypothetical protein